MLSMANTILTQGVVAVYALHWLQDLLRQRGVERMDLLPPLTGDMPTEGCAVADEDSGLKMLITFRAEPPALGGNWSRRMTFYVKNDRGTHQVSEAFYSEDLLLDLELFWEKILRRPITMLVDMLLPDTENRERLLEPADVRVQRILDRRAKEKAEVTD